MNSCILTIIKDEHLYLDEWIKYHLDIGVFHIFIFEDVGSKSHQAIVEKYSDKVTLAPALSILSEEEKNLVLTNRAKNIPGGQKTYVKAGLRYIKENYDYDWCFVIDNDEFLTFEKNKNLDTTLKLYKNYDAFIMSWKCYGANGLVKMPDYSKKGVIDTFTEPIKGYVPTTSQEHNKKICWNLHTYIDSFWNTIHIPSTTCNYCNTEFKKDPITLCYNNIYIRHYITKSWEEYIWKKRTRGYFYGLIRTPDAFFRMNPDMLPLKDSLMPKNTLVVLPYSGRHSQGDEIHLALNGWKKFCTFDYHFVVIGDFDERLVEEYPWVEFISFKQTPMKRDQYNPHIDIQHKMQKIYDLFHFDYRGFIWMVDDNYAIKPFSLKDIMTIHYHQKSFTGVENLPASCWKHDKWKTRQLVDKEGFSNINYTTHYPCYFEFERLKQLWDKYNMMEESYVLEDIYFNSFKHPDPILDSTIRLGIWSRSIFERDFNAAINNPNIKFVCNSVEGWSKKLEEALKLIILCEQK